LVRLKRSHRVVLVEGNYLLLYDDPLWAPLRPLFDERCFLRVGDISEQGRRLIHRHLETWTPEKDRLWGPGGAGEAGAAAKADANDIPNVRLVATTERYADLIVDSVTEPSLPLPP